MRCYYTLTGLAEILSQTIPSDEEMEQQELIPSWWESHLVRTLGKNSWVFSITEHPPCDPAITLPWSYD